MHNKQSPYFFLLNEFIFPSSPHWNDFAVMIKEFFWLCFLGVFAALSVYLWPCRIRCLCVTGRGAGTLIQPICVSAARVLPWNIQSPVKIDLLTWSLFPPPPHLPPPLSDQIPMELHPRRTVISHISGMTKFRAGTTAAAHSAGAQINGILLSGGARWTTPTHWLDPLIGYHMDVLTTNVALMQIDEGNLSPLSEIWFCVESSCCFFLNAKWFWLIVGESIEKYYQVSDGRMWISSTKLVALLLAIWVYCQSSGHWMTASFIILIKKSGIYKSYPWLQGPVI